MPAKLTVCYPDRPAIEAVLFEHNDYRVGRSNHCDLVVEHPSVSRHHALVSYHDQQWLVHDEQSQNGTRVNGVLINGVQLQGNELISVGAIDCLFEIKNEQQLIASNQFNAWRLQQAKLNQARLTKQSLLQGLDERLFSLLSLTGMQRGLILLGNELKQLRVFAAKGMTKRDFTEQAFEGSVGTLTMVCRSTQPVIAMDVSLAQQLAQRESVKRKNIAAVACLPMLTNGQLFGLAYLDSNLSGKVLSELDIEIMHCIGQQLELNLQALMVQDQVSDLIKYFHMKPPNKGLLNRSLVSLVNYYVGARMSE